MPPVPPDQLDPDRGDPCSGCSHTVVLIAYAAPQGRPDSEGQSVPLRCGRPDCAGRDGWGYRHFASRWAGAGTAEHFHRDIATTLERGRRRRVERGTVRYDMAWAGDRRQVDRAVTVIISLRPQ